MFQNSSSSVLTTDFVSAFSSVANPLTAAPLATTDSGSRLSSLASSDVRDAPTVAPHDSAVCFDVRYLQGNDRPSYNGELLSAQGIVDT